MGTVHLLEALRDGPSVRSIVVVTTDKVYPASDTPHRETDPVGGHDPYAASKAAAEHVVSAYYSSFFRAANVACATARAGNVIGGGDWSSERLVPDVVRSLIASSDIELRNPGGIRPWQHVLEPAAAYMLLAANMLNGHAGACSAWNLGPQADDGELTVAAVVKEFCATWPTDTVPEIVERPGSFVEAPVLRLDASLAEHKLGWRCALSADEAVTWTSSWYSDVLLGAHNAWDRCSTDIEQYVALLHQRRVPWVSTNN